MLKPPVPPPPLAPPPPPYQYDSSLEEHHLLISYPRTSAASPPEECVSEKVSQSGNTAWMFPSAAPSQDDSDEFLISLSHDAIQYASQAKRRVSVSECAESPPMCILECSQRCDDESEAQRCAHQPQRQLLVQHDQEPPPLLLGAEQPLSSVGSQKPNPQRTTPQRRTRRRRLRGARAPSPEVLKRRAIRLLLHLLDRTEPRGVSPSAGQWQNTPCCPSPLRPAEAPVPRDVINSPRRHAMGRILPLDRMAGEEEEMSLVVSPRLLLGRRNTLLRIEQQVTPPKLTPVSHGALETYFTVIDLAGYLAVLMYVFSPPLVLEILVEVLTCPTIEYRTVPEDVALRRSYLVYEFITTVLGEGDCFFSSNCRPTSCFGTFYAQHDTGRTAMHLMQNPIVRKADIASWVLVSDSNNPWNTRLSDQDCNEASPQMGGLSYRHCEPLDLNNNDDDGDDDDDDDDGGDDDDDDDDEQRDVDPAQQLHKSLSRLARVIMIEYGVPIREMLSLRAAMFPQTARQNSHGKRLSTKLLFSDQPVPGYLSPSCCSKLSVASGYRGAKKTKPEHLGDGPPSRRRRYRQRKNSEFPSRHQFHSRCSWDDFSTFEFPPPRPQHTSLRPGSVRYSRDAIQVKLPAVLLRYLLDHKDIVGLIVGLSAIASERTTSCRHARSHTIHICRLLDMLYSLYEQEEFTELLTSIDGIQCLTTALGQPGVSDFFLRLLACGLPHTSMCIRPSLVEQLKAERWGRQLIASLTAEGEAARAAAASQCLLSGWRAAFGRQLIQKLRLSRIYSAYCNALFLREKPLRYGKGLSFLLKRFAAHMVHVQEKLRQRQRADETTCGWKSTTSFESSTSFLQSDAAAAGSSNPTVFRSLSSSSMLIPLAYNDDRFEPVISFIKSLLSLPSVYDKETNGHQLLSTLPALLHVLPQLAIWCFISDGFQWTGLLLLLLYTRYLQADRAGSLLHGATLRRRRPTEILTRRQRSPSLDSILDPACLSVARPSTSSFWTSLDFLYDFPLRHAGLPKTSPGCSSRLSPTLPQRDPADIFLTSILAQDCCIYPSCAARQTLQLINFAGRLALEEFTSELPEINTSTHLGASRSLSTAPPPEVSDVAEFLSRLLDGAVRPQFASSAPLVNGTTLKETSGSINNDNKATDDTCLVPEDVDREAYTSEGISEMSPLLELLKMVFARRGFIPTLMAAIGENRHRRAVTDLLVVTIQNMYPSRPLWRYCTFFSTVLCDGLPILCRAFVAELKPCPSFRGVMRSGVATATLCSESPSSVGSLTPSVDTTASSTACQSLKSTSYRQSRRHVTSLALQLLGAIKMIVELDPTRSLPLISDESWQALAQLFVTQRQCSIFAARCFSIFHRAIGFGDLTVIQEALINSGLLDSLVGTLAAARRHDGPTKSDRPFHGEFGAVMSFALLLNHIYETVWPQMERAASSTTVCWTSAPLASSLDPPTPPLQSCMVVDSDVSVTSGSASHGKETESVLDSIMEHSNGVMNFQLYDTAEEQKEIERHAWQPIAIHDETTSSPAVLVADDETALQQKYPNEIQNLASESIEPGNDSVQERLTLVVEYLGRLPCWAEVSSLLRLVEEARDTSTSMTSIVPLAETKRLRDCRKSVERLVQLERQQQYQDLQDTDA